MAEEEGPASLAAGLSRRPSALRSCVWVVALALASSFSRAESAPARTTTGPSAFGERAEPDSATTTTGPSASGARAEPDPARTTTGPSASGARAEPAPSRPSRQRRARPDEHDERLDRFGPPSSPRLSHRGLESDFEITFARAEPTDIVSYEPIESRPAYAYSARLMVEATLADRDWYLGLAEEVAGATVPPGDTAGSGGATLIVGNPELWARGLWSSDLGLSAGGGLSLVLPFPRTFTSLESEVVRAVRVIRPWHYAHYQDSGLTARPYFDVRHVAGPVTIQVRQGLDALFRLRDLAPEEERYDLAALLSLYAGVRAPRWMTTGLELSELYLISSQPTPAGCAPPCDEHRAIVVVSPSLRLHLAGFTTGLSLLVPLSTPLRAEVDSFLAARLHVALPLAW